MRDVERGFGIKLPGDLETVLGKRLILAAPAQRLAGDGVPTLGARVQTKAAEAVLTRVDRRLRQAGWQLPVRHRAEGGELFVATSNRYLQWLAQRGTLGEDETFRTAVANPASAVVSFFLDLDVSFHARLVGD